MQYFRQKFRDHPWVVLFLLAPTIKLTTLWITHVLIHQPRSPETYLKADQLPEVYLEMPVSISAIAAHIDLEDHRTEVEIQVVHPSLREIEFELPSTDPASIEIALSHELALSPLFIQEFLNPLSVD